jgi:FkbM family methyltransferase
VSNILRTTNRLAEHAFYKLAAPAKERAWSRKTAPFWHRGARGLEFELYPGELIDYYIFTHGLFEKRFLFLIEQMFSDGRTALDIGANIGNHSLFFSRVFGAVHAFEPNPLTLERLNRNIARNDADNVVVHGIGLSEAPTQLHFLAHAGGNAGHSRFVDGPEDGSQELPVERGDDVVAQSKIIDVDFIKVDVEGHELAALRGLSRTIERDQPVVAFEFHSRDFPEGYFSAFQAALPGYAFFECVLRDRNANVVQKVSDYLRSGGLPTVTPMRLRHGRSYENILAVPSGFDTARFGGLLKDNGES